MKEEVISLWLVTEQKKGRIYMNHFFKIVKKDMILVTIFQLLAGLLLLLFPQSVVRTVCYICAAALLIYGVMHAVSYFGQKTPEYASRYDLVKGIFGIAAGIILFARPGILSGILFWILGILILLDSIMKLQDALDLKKLGYQSWWLVMLVGILMAVMGVLILCNPFGTASMLVSFAGAVLVVNACVDLWDIFYISGKVKKFLNK